MNKKKQLSLLLFFSICIFLAISYFVIPIAPFSKDKDIVQIKIQSLEREDGSITVILEEEYAQEVLDVLYSIRIFRKPVTAPTVPATYPHMFLLVCRDGTIVSVGNNYPNIIIDGKQYVPFSDNSRENLDKLIHLFADHPVVTNYYMSLQKVTTSPSRITIKAAHRNILWAALLHVVRSYLGVGSIEPRL